MINVRKIVFKIVFIERTCRDVNYVNQLCHSLLYRSLVIPSVKNASKVLNPFEGSIEFYRVNLKNGYVFLKVMKSFLLGLRELRLLSLEVRRFISDVFL